MKTIKNLMMIVLAAVMMITVCACGESSEEEGKQIDTSKLTDGNNVITEAQSELQKQIKDKGGKITILSPHTEKSITAQCWAAQYKAMCGGTIEWITESYSNMQQKLAALHAAGTSPDIYFVTNQDFPSLMYKNILTNLNEHLDFSSEVWDNKQQDLSMLTWDGINYFIPTITPDRGIWWNKTLFTEAGVPENEWPDAQVKADTWTWDSFYELEKKLSNKENGVYGFGYLYNLCYAFPNSTGEDIVKLGDSGLESNITSPNITRSLNFMKKVCDKNYCFNTGNTADGGVAFRKEKIAMYYDTQYPSWTDENAKKLINEGTYGFTHFPRDPQQKEYINIGSITGLAIPVGAKNVDAALAFLQMFQASDNYLKQSRMIQYEDYSFNDDLIDFMENEFLTEKYTPLYSNGIKEIQATYWDASLGTLMQEGQTWESVSASIKPAIDLELGRLGS